MVNCICWFSLLNSCIYFDSLKKKGLVSLKKPNDPNERVLHDLASPLPVTLLPSKFPEKEFNYALELQKHFQELIYLISKDFEFLKESLKE